MGCVWGAAWAGGAGWVEDRAAGIPTRPPVWATGGVGCPVSPPAPACWELEVPLKTETLAVPACAGSLANVAVLRWAAADVMVTAGGCWAPEGAAVTTAGCWGMSAPPAPGTICLEKMTEEFCLAVASAMVDASGILMWFRLEVVGLVTSPDSVCTTRFMVVVTEPTTKS